METRYPTTKYRIDFTSTGTSKDRIIYLRLENRVAYLRSHPLLSGYATFYLGDSDLRRGSGSNRKGVVGVRKIIFTHRNASYPTESWSQPVHVTAPKNRGFLFNNKSKVVCRRLLDLWKIPPRYCYYCYLPLTGRVWIKEDSAGNRALGRCDACLKGWTLWVGPSNENLLLPTTAETTFFQWRLKWMFFSFMKICHLPVHKLLRFFRNQSWKQSYIGMQTLKLTVSKQSLNFWNNSTV